MNSTAPVAQSRHLTSYLGAAQVWSMAPHRTARTIARDSKFGSMSGTPQRQSRFGRAVIVRDHLSRPVSARRALARRGLFTLACPARVVNGAIQEAHAHEASCPWCPAY